MQSLMPSKLANEAAPASRPVPLFTGWLTFLTLLFASTILPLLLVLIGNSFVFADVTVTPTASTNEYGTLGENTGGILVSSSAPISNSFPLSVTVVEQTVTSTNSDAYYIYFTDQRIYGILQCVEMFQKTNQTDPWYFQVNRCGKQGDRYYTYGNPMLNRAFSCPGDHSMGAYNSYSDIYSGNTDCITANYIGFLVWGVETGKQVTVRATFGW